jgi:hypothetical protein
MGFANLRVVLRLTSAARASINLIANLYLLF